MLAFIFIISLLIGGLFLYKYFNYHKGSLGEQKTRDTLQNLPDSYSLINDLKLPNSYGNIDHIVLGGNGIFVIETKNFKEEISCNGERWYQYKKKWETGRKSEIKSPSKQVKRNAVNLKNYIYSKNVFSKSLRLWIEGIVVFSDENVILDRNNPTVPVFKVNQLCNYIKNKESNVKFSTLELEKVARILLENV